MTTKVKYFYAIASLFLGVLLFMVFLGERLFQPMLGRLFGILMLDAHPFTPKRLSSDTRVLPTDARTVDLIRVGISDDGMTDYEHTDVAIGAIGPFQITSSFGSPPIFKGTAGQVIILKHDEKGFWLKTKDVHSVLGPFSGQLTVQPMEGNCCLTIPSVTRRGQVPRYRGILEIIPVVSDRTKLRVVNVLPMQDYLKAVVPNELPIHYGVEAVKAQAIAARNYAIRPREKPWTAFDICDSQYCQAYYGAQTETSQTTEALKDTEGLVALYEGQPILALYSSSHGGYGERYAYVFSDPRTNRFPGEDIPYLQGGPDLRSVSQKFGQLYSESAARRFWESREIDSFDKLSPHYRWEKEWPIVELEEMLPRTLAECSRDPLTQSFITPAFQGKEPFGELKAMTVKRRGVSGKAMVLQVDTTQGQWIIEKEFVIRKVLQHRGRMLPSANIVLTPLYQGLGSQKRWISLKIQGGGFGHGVGMSQLGASWMAKHGKRYPDILQHYYKGIAIGSMPLQVGSDAFKRPVKTTFHSPQNTGMLWIETLEKPNQEVVLQLNDRLYRFSPKQFKSVSTPTSAKYILTQSVSGLMTHQGKNTMILFPESADSRYKIKAWVELFPAQKT